MLYGADFQPKHDVNVEQALTAGGLLSNLGTARRSNALVLNLNNLMRENGLSCGINSGTEFLSATRGARHGVCAIVEAMLSLETAVRITGNPVLADHLETVSFNAMPAALANNTRPSNTTRCRTMSLR